MEGRVYQPPLQQEAEDICFHPHAQPEKWKHACAYVCIRLTKVPDGLLPDKDQTSSFLPGEKGASGTAEIFDQQERQQRAHICYRTAQG